MIGRAAIGYPWIFNEIKHYLNTGEYLPPPTIDQRCDAIRDHLSRSSNGKARLSASWKCAAIIQII